MADNLYAGSSVQVFADMNWKNLEHTHEDVKGFLDYVSKFNAPNFRITDDDVSATMAVRPGVRRRRRLAGGRLRQGLLPRRPRGDEHERDLRDADGQHVGDPQLGVLQSDGSGGSEAGLPVPAVRVRFCAHHLRRRPVAHLE